MGEDWIEGNFEAGLPETHLYPNGEHIFIFLSFEHAYLTPF